MAIVVDASSAIAWIMPDERHASHAPLLRRIGDEGAIVPGLWPIEVANVLLFAERRRRISAADRVEALRFLNELPIEIDSETAAQAWGATLGLAERFRLTLYDAAYLELAQRRGLPLASLDRDLRKAGRALGLDVLGA